MSQNVLVPLGITVTTITICAAWWFWKKNKAELHRDDGASVFVNQPEILSTGSNCSHDHIHSESQTPASCGLCAKNVYNDIEVLEVQQCDASTFCEILEKYHDSTWEGGPVSELGSSGDAGIPKDSVDDKVGNSNTIQKVLEIPSAQHPDENQTQSQLDKTVKETSAEQQTVNPTCYEFIFPRSLAGRIIGRKGCHIAEMKKESGASIYVKDHSKNKDKAIFQVRDLEELDFCIQCCYHQKSFPFQSVPLVGNLCVAPGKNRWNRAQIVAIRENGNSCVVRFLDYGGYAIVASTDLCQLRSDLADFPLQAVECGLADVHPSEDADGE